MYLAQTPPAGHITRRALLAGTGVAVGVSGIGWLIRSPPQLVAQYTYRGHHDFVNAVAWSPDGTYIASGGWDTTVQVWQPQLG